MSTLPILFAPLALEDLPITQQQLIQQIDAVLPQTQCGLCGYKDGCLPYAHAIATQNEAIHLCVPGGNQTAAKIAALTQRPFVSAATSKWPTDPKTNRPIEVRAVIIEDDCIGCTKCIAACPVDAIIGTAKHMHSIMTDLCTGCELCVPPCPVDCIDIVPHARVIDEHTQKQEQQDLKRRYHSHLNRLSQNLNDNNAIVISHTQSTLANLQNQATQPSTDAIYDTIALAKIRTQLKKLHKQLQVRPNPIKQAEYDRLQRELATKT